MKQTYGQMAVLAAAGLALSLSVKLHAGAQTTPPLRFEISFPASVRAERLTGRVFVIVAGGNSPEPRLQVGSWGGSNAVLRLRRGTPEPGAGGDN